MALPGVKGLNIVEVIFLGWQEAILTPGGALHILWVRGRAIGKGIDFHILVYGTVSTFTILV